MQTVANEGDTENGTSMGEWKEGREGGEEEIENSRNTTHRRK